MVMQNQKDMTDNAWDEQIVNNIKIKKLHYLPKAEEVEDEEQQENIDAFVAKYKIPVKEMGLFFRVRNIHKRSCCKGNRKENLMKTFKEFFEEAKQGHALVVGGKIVARGSKSALLKKVKKDKIKLDPKGDQNFLTYTGKEVGDSW